MWILEKKKDKPKTNRSNIAKKNLRDKLQFRKLKWKGIFRICRMKQHEAQNKTLPLKIERENPAWITLYYLIET